MAFTSAVFIFAFLPLAVLIHAAVRNVKARNFILAVFSLVFWAWSGVFALPVMLLVSAAVFFGAKALAHTDGVKKKLLLAALIMLVLIPLAACLILRRTAAEVFVPKFFCFGFLALRMIGYLIEVYSGKCAPEKKFGNLLLYSSFFALMPRGPIVSYSVMRESLGSRIVPLDMLCKGVCDFVIGLSMKLIVSDTIAFACDKLFALNGTDLNVLTAWIAAGLFFLQLYFDLWGYSKMAVGIGRMFGFELPANFVSPVFADSFTGFLKRWHVTFTEWFVEFVYGPISKRVKGFFGAVLGIVIVCAAAAVWHGANPAILICFAIVACFLLAESGLKKLGVRLPRWNGFVLVVFGAVISFASLRTKGAISALALYRSMFTGFVVTHVSVSKLSLIMKPNAIAAAVIAVILASPLGALLGRALSKDGAAVKIVRYTLTVLLLAACIMTLLSTDAHPGFFEML